jgi:hypothetical protein
MSDDTQATTPAPQATAHWWMVEHPGTGYSRFATTQELKDHLTRWPRIANDPGTKLFKLTPITAADLESA